WLAMKADHSCAIRFPVHDVDLVAHHMIPDDVLPFYRAALAFNERLIAAVPVLVHVLTGIFSERIVDISNAFIPSHHSRSNAFFPVKIVEDDKFLLVALLGYVRKIALYDRVQIEIKQRPFKLEQFDL